MADIREQIKRKYGVDIETLNLLVFLLMWLVPTPLIAGMVNKY